MLKRWLTAARKNFLHDFYADFRIRAPYYVSDWKDALNYRVVPSTVYIFFANLLPAIAFAQDMFDRTNGAYGVNEVLMASAMGGIVFGLFSGQPLVVVGVTGPITIFNYTVFEIIVPRGTPYFPFICWICIWSFILHTMITIANGVRYMRYVTLFSCDIFGSFINIIYIQKGIQILTRQFRVGSEEPASIAGAYFSIVTALSLFMFGILFYGIGNYSPFFTSRIRKFLSDYSLPLCVVFFTGFTFFPGRIASLNVLRLPTAEAFKPSSKMYGRDYGWFIHFWEIAAADVFLALPFAILLTGLFYFDHNISSIMSQGPQFKFKKPSAFHWDFFVLGCTTLVSGLLGIPAPNGLIPQAPLHTKSLIQQEVKPGEAAEVIEQRFTNMAQGLITIGMMSGPLLVVLHLVPQGVLAGLFFMMGVPGLFESTIVRRLYLLFMDVNLRDHSEQLYWLSPKRWHLFMLLSVLGVGAEVAITQTIAAIGFPGVLFLFMILGAYLDKIFTSKELEALDGPAASDFVLRALDRDVRPRRPSAISRETLATTGRRNTYT